MDRYQFITLDNLTLATWVIESQNVSWLTFQLTQDESVPNLGEESLGQYEKLVKQFDRKIEIGEINEDEKEKIEQLIAHLDCIMTSIMR